MNSRLSPHSLFSSAYEESRATEAFCQALRRVREGHPVVSSSESSLQPYQPIIEKFGKPVLVYPLSLTSLFSSADEESKVMDAFCLAFRRLSTAHAQNL
ncbi:hypothetical protein PMAYCL1PPCAC_27915, partial [Pristionchus mayeri]